VRSYFIIVSNLAPFPVSLTPIINRYSS